MASRNGARAAKPTRKDQTWQFRLGKRLRDGGWPQWAIGMLSAALCTYLGAYTSGPGGPQVPRRSCILSICMCFLTLGLVVSLFALLSIRQLGVHDTLREIKNWTPGTLELDDEVIMAPFRSVFGDDSGFDDLMPATPGEVEPSTPPAPAEATAPTSVSSVSSAEVGSAVAPSIEDYARAEELYGEGSTAADASAQDPRRAALLEHAKKVQQQASEVSKPKKLDLEPDFTPMATLDDMQLRGARCFKSWFNANKAGQPSCFSPQGVPCPVDHTPEMLDSAQNGNQATCLDTSKYFCTIQCKGVDEETAWSASPCGGENQIACPPVPSEVPKDDPRRKRKTFGLLPGDDGEVDDRFGSIKKAEEATKKWQSEHSEEATKAMQAKKQQDGRKHLSEQVKEGSPEAAKKLGWVKGSAGGLPAGTLVNLQGLQCELLDGKERCFLQDSQGRELCPEHVTAKYLTEAHGQQLCTEETHFCTVMCQEGVKDIRWTAYEHAYCKQNRDACVDAPPRTPVDKFWVKPWSGLPRMRKQCEDIGYSEQLASKQRKQGAGGGGLRGSAQGGAGVGPLQAGYDPEELTAMASPADLSQVSVGILTRPGEEPTLGDTLQTYDEGGFLARMGEVNVLVNGQSAKMDDLLGKYEAKYPDSFHVTREKGNTGIALGINKLAFMSEKPYFLFLEKDFRLVDPWGCAHEQLARGIELLKAGTAHVIRYRSRDRAGRPNWAEKMFAGHEDDVFKRQNNLFCNVYYWLKRPDQRWPDKIWPCEQADEEALVANEEAESLPAGEGRRRSAFFCSKAFYCNWTNNPFLVEVAWWKKEYADKFKDFKHHSPIKDLEYYMNWEPGAWNDRPWIVAQGDGLFKHQDRNNPGF